MGHLQFLRDFPAFSAWGDFVFSKGKLGSQNHAACPQNVLPAILEPDMAAPILWAPRIFGSLFRKASMPIKLDAAFLLTVGSFLLTVELFYLQLRILAFLLTIGAFPLTALACLLTVGAFLLTVGNCV